MHRIPVWFENLRAKRIVSNFLTCSKNWYGVTVMGGLPQKLDNVEGCLQTFDRKIAVPRILTERNTCMRVLHQSM